MVCLAEGTMGSTMSHRRLAPVALMRSAAGTIANMTGERATEMAEAAIIGGEEEMRGTAVARVGSASARHGKSGTGRIEGGPQTGTARITTGRRRNGIVRAGSQGETDMERGAGAMTAIDEIRSTRAAGTLPDSPLMIKGSIGGESTAIETWVTGGRRRIGDIGKIEASPNVTNTVYASADEMGAAVPC